MCSRSVFPIFLVIQWSPHPGPGFPTFAGIFEFAIRYFALERCFPLSAGTLFILLSLEVPRYQDTPSAQVLMGIIRSPLSKNLQRVLLRRDPFRHQPLPHLVFCFHIMLISSEFLRFERKCGRGWLQPAELSISSQTHGITAHVNVPETGPAFGAIF